MTTHTGKNLIVALLTLVCLSNAGCARLNSIHRSESVRNGTAKVIFVDAKQRSLLISPVSRGIGTDKETILRFCSEPSPDAFTAIASTLGAKAIVGTQGQKQDISAEYGQAISENSSSIERSQTTNILREMMFRNCERYISGAISETEFIVQASRDQNAIVSVLAIEQLTGAARAQAIALTTLAETASKGPGEASVQTLDNAMKSLQKQLTTAEKARKEAEILPPAGPCQTGDGAYQDSGAAKAEVDAKKSACVTADKADATAKQADEHYAKVADAVEKQHEQSVRTQGEHKAAEKAANEIAPFIAATVENIVRAHHDFDEIKMTCVVLFRNLAAYRQMQQENSRLAAAADEKGSAVNASDLAANSDEFARKCLAYMSAEFDMKRAESEYSAELFDARTEALIRTKSEAIVETFDKDARRVYDYSTANGKFDPRKLSALIEKATPDISPGAREDMLAAESLSAFSKAFRRVLPFQQRKLAAATGAQD